VHRALQVNLLMPVTRFTGKKMVSQVRLQPGEMRAILRKPFLHSPGTVWALNSWPPMTLFHHWNRLLTGTLREWQPSGSGRQTNFSTAGICCEGDSLHCFSHRTRSIKRRLSRPTTARRDFDR
jgi:hypothetical protein